MSLDDRSEIRKIDRSDMLGVMEKAFQRLVPPADARTTCRIKTESPANVVFAGVGGSGIVGDFMADYCRNWIGVPVTVCRSTHIPKFVGTSTFLVAISYSGETRETIGMFEEAERKGAKLAVIASAGQLLNLAQKRSLPHLKITGGMIPRVALPELVAATTYLLGEAGMLEDWRELLDSAAASMRDVIERVGSAVLLASNPAKQMATALDSRLPLLIGSEDNASVLRRFKNELNENSKVPAIVNTLPEGCHDDVEGFQALQHFSQTQPVVLRSESETEGERRVEETLVKVLSQLGFPPALFFNGSGKGRFEWLLSAITFGDFVSVYLALLRGIDPSNLSLIPTFRAIRGQV